MQLKGLGWKVCRFWVYELREDMQACVDKVLKIIKDHSDGK
jgi:very-short-patch-repair endonuclease